MIGSEKSARRQAELEAANVTVCPDSITDDRGIPHCKKHFVRMQSFTSNKTKTFFRCRVDGCDQRAIQVRKRCRIPDVPQFCPRCSDQSPDGVACVVKCFRELTVELNCPKGCGYKVTIERHDADRQRRKIAVEQLNEAAGLGRRPGDQS